MALLCTQICKYSKHSKLINLHKLRLAIFFSEFMIYWLILFMLITRDACAQLFSRNQQKICSTLINELSTSLITEAFNYFDIRYDLIHESPPRNENHLLPHNEDRAISLLFYRNVFHQIAFGFWFLLFLEGRTEDSFKAASTKRSY